jgi:hypothetical protein
MAVIASGSEVGLDMALAIVGNFSRSDHGRSDGWR